MTSPSAAFGTARQLTISGSAREQILTTAIFKIENAQGTAIFSELAGINSEVEMAEYMEAGEKGPEYGRFVGKLKPPTVTLKRAMSSGPDTTWIWAWHQLARSANSPAAYMDTYFMLYGASNPNVQMQYQLTNAFPAKVDIAGMKAGGTEVVIQTVTIQCDEIIGL